MDRQEQVLLNGLQEENRDFTVFPSDAADQFRAQDGKLVNASAGQEYRAFVLPMCEALPIETARLLEAYVRQGGNLAILEKVPRYAMKREQDGELKELMERILAYPQTVFFETVDTRQVLEWLEAVCPRELRILEGIRTCKKNFAHYPDWVIDPYIHTGEDLDGISWTVFEGERTNYYFVNYTDREQEIVAEVPSGMRPEIWDSLTGEIREADVLEKGAGAVYRVRMRLPKGYGIFLVTSKSIA
ncbi:MAG: hypothetical protein Q4F41_17460 [Eubacteriales bacterium]|nr:hypothetical protein [Eubacteriales bacterium]